MSIFSRLFGSQPTVARIEPQVTVDQTKTKIKSWGVATSSPLLGFALGAMPSNTGIPVSHMTALESSTAYACIRAKSDDIAKLPIRMYRKAGKGNSQEITDHPVLSLLRRPNGWQNSYEFISHIVTHHALYGNSYTWIDRDVAGRPIRLVPILPTMASPLIIENGLLYNISNQFIGTRQAISEDMLHIRNLSLDEGIWGVSPIACGQNVLGLALAEQKHAATTFARGAQLGGIITHPGVVSEEAATRMAQSWQAAYAGSDNAHKTAFLEEGAEWHAMTQTAADSQLLESRKHSVEEVARWFGVPQHRIGALDRATYSNIEAEQQNYIDQSLVPTAKRIEIALEDKLLFEAERQEYYIRFDFDEMLRTDTKTRYEAHAIGLQNGFLTQNEVRAEENLNPIPDGDVCRVALNMSNTATQSGSPKTPPDSSGTPET